VPRLVAAARQRPKRRRQGSETPATTELLSLATPPTARQSMELGLLRNLVLSGADPQRASRVGGDALSRLARAAVSFLVASQAPQIPVAAPIVYGIHDVYVVHGFLRPREAEVLKKLFHTIKPHSSLRSGFNRATKCLLRLITKRATNLFTGQRLTELTHFFGTSPQDTDNLDVVHLVNHNVILRPSSNGSLLLNDQSVVFSRDSAPEETPVTHFPQQSKTTLRLCASFFLASIGAETLTFEEG